LVSNGGAAAALLLRAVEAKEWRKWTVNRSASAWGAHVVAGRARTPTARGSAVSRPATGGATRHPFSETNITVACLKR